MDRDQSPFPPSEFPQSDRPHEQSVSDLTNALERSQRDIENERVALVRILHDDFGGLLVGAIMDIGWVCQQAGHSQPVREKLARATGLLRAAIDMKRELIENLRPTLLENVGLFSTLRWQVKASCDAAGVAYSANFPASEVTLPSDLKIGVFRIFQEGLNHVLADGAPRDLSVDVEVIEDALYCHLTSASFDGWRARENERPSPETSMRHRAQCIGGTLQWLRVDGENHIRLQIPLTHPRGPLNMANIG
jgi:signal transduction histidine kinase